MKENGKMEKWNKMEKIEKVVKLFNSPLELHADDWHNVWSDLIFD